MAKPLAYHSKHSWQIQTQGLQTQYVLIYLVALGETDRLLVFFHFFTDPLCAIEIFYKQRYCEDLMLINRLLLQYFMKPSWCYPLLPFPFLESQYWWLTQKVCSWSSLRLVLCNLLGLLCVTKKICMHRKYWFLWLPRGIQRPYWATEMSSKWSQGKIASVSNGCDSLQHVYPLCGRIFAP